MREIKFRGKDKRSGEWYYGNIFIADTLGRTHVGTTTRMSLDIDPATVGQYTGLKDYNDKEIYEGDILKASALNLPDIVKVGFKWGSFVLVDKHGEIIGSLWDYDPDAFEVIGNIHDNPELMKTVDD